MLDLESRDSIEIAIQGHERNVSPHRMCCDDGVEIASPLAGSHQFPMDVACKLGQLRCQRIQVQGAQEPADAPHRCRTAGTFPKFPRHQ